MNKKTKHPQVERAEPPPCHYGHAQLLISYR